MLRIVRGAVIVMILLAVSAVSFSDMTPAAVTDPDGKVPAKLDLPRVKLSKSGSITVKGGDAYWEQSIVVWRSNAAASITQVGQVARGSGAGDASHRPTSLTLNEKGDYYFACWHKVRPDESRADSKHISQVAWTRSAERLTGNATTGYTLSCEDSTDADYNDIIAEITVK
jgi:hypothetical protein